MNGGRRIVCVATLIAMSLGFGLFASRVMGQTQAESLAESFRKAAERVAPSVVAVRPLDPSLLTSVPNPPIGPIRPFGIALGWHFELAMGGRRTHGVRRRGRCQARIYLDE